MHALARDQRSTVGRADPHAAVARDVQAHHIVARQPVGHAEIAQLAVLDSAEPARGPDPQGAVARLDDGAYLVAGETAVDVAHRLDAAVPAHQAVGVGADPHAAAARRGQAQDGVAGQAVGAGEHTEVAIDVAVEPAAGADPQHTVVGLEQGADVVVRQAVLDRVGGEGRIAQAQQTAVGAHPQAAFPVLQQRGDAVVGQARQAAEGLHAAVHPAQQTVVHRADPQGTVAAPQQTRGGIARQVGRGRHEALALAPVQALLGAHEQAAVGFGEQAEHRSWRQALGRTEGLDVPLAQARQAVRRARPQRAVGAQRHAVHDVAGQAVGLAEVAEAAAIVPIDAGALGGDPQTAVGQGYEVHDLVLAQALARGQRGPLLAGVAVDTTAGGAHPQGAVRGDTQHAHAVVLQRRHVAAVEGAEIQAVVARQTFPGAEPQIAFGRLGNGRDEVVRQALARGPDVAGVLVQGPRRRRERQRQHPEQPGQHPRQPARTPCLPLAHAPLPRGRGLRITRTRRRRRRPGAP